MKKIINNLFQAEVFDFPYFKYFLFASLLFSVIFISARFFTKKNNIVFLFLGNGIIILGLTIGIIMGNNRNPISDTIMSSILSLLGGLLALMFFKKEDIEEGKEKKFQFVVENNRPIVLFFLILFPLSLLYGAHTGSRYRIENEKKERVIQYNTQLFQDSAVIWVKQQEAEIEIDKLKAQTWSENEKKRFEYLLNHPKQKDSIPNAPVYKKAGR